MEENFFRTNLLKKKYFFFNQILREKKSRQKHYRQTDIQIAPIIYNSSSLSSRIRESVKELSKIIVSINRWQEEQDAEQRRKDAMKLGDEERETILQVIMMNNLHIVTIAINVNEDMAAAGYIFVI